MLPPQSYQDYFHSAKEKENLVAKLIAHLYRENHFHLRQVKLLENVLFTLTISLLMKVESDIYIYKTD